MNNVYRSAGFNPYLIANGKEANNIVFFRDGEVVAETRSGWFGNNHIEVAEMHLIDFSRANKVNLNREDSFYINNNVDSYSKDKVALYVNLDEIPSLVIEPLGELIAAEDDETIYYGQFYNMTATFEGERKTVKIMSRTYSQVVKKEKRIKKEAFAEYMQEEYRINSYDSGKIFDNIEKIAEMAKSV